MRFSIIFWVKYSSWAHHKQISKIFRFAKDIPKNMGSRCRWLRCNPLNYFSLKNKKLIIKVTNKLNLILFENWVSVVLDHTNVKANLKASHWLNRNNQPKRVLGIVYTSNKIILKYLKMGGYLWIEFCTLQSNIFAKSKNFAKPFCSLFIRGLHTVESFEEKKIWWHCFFKLRTNAINVWPLLPGQRVHGAKTLEVEDAAVLHGSSDLLPLVLMAHF